MTLARGTRAAARCACRQFSQIKNDMDKSQATTTVSSAKVYLGGARQLHMLHCGCQSSALPCCRPYWPRRLIINLLPTCAGYGLRTQVATLDPYFVDWIDALASDPNNTDTMHGFIDTFGTHVISR